MKTISDYLDNMFATLPKTRQLQQLKDELLANMEDKYNELKGEGKSENEAIGIVISEFGNIDELRMEFNIQPEEEETEFPLLTEEDVDNFLEVNKRTSKFIGAGVFLCILGAALLIFTIQLVADGLIPGISEGVGSSIGLIILLVLVATAVGLFIYSGMMNDKYKFIDKDGEFELPHNLKKLLEVKNNEFHSTFTLSIIFGVMLCILSPVSLFIMLAINEEAINYGVVILLLLISIAVNIFIYYGGIKNSYKKLLRLDEYSERHKEENKVISAVATIIWPLAVCIFLVSGLMFDQWHINWLIFPITGILFGMFSGAYSVIKGKN